MPGALQWKRVMRIGWHGRCSKFRILIIWCKYTRFSLRIFRYSKYFGRMVSYLSTCLNWQQAQYTVKNHWTKSHHSLRTRVWRILLDTSHGKSIPSIALILSSALPHIFISPWMWTKPITAANIRYACNWRDRTPKDHSEPGWASLDQVLTKMSRLRYLC